MPRIRSLKPNVTRDEAIRQFSPSGPLALFHNAMFGPLRSVAELYIPFRFFRVQIVNRGVIEERLVALEAISGALDLYQFENVPAESDTVLVETRNCPAAELPAAEATERVVTKIRRVIYSRGFFRVRGLQITALPLPEEIYVPYWLGFRSSGSQARLSVIDAVRRRVEGAKMRRLVETWLSTPP
jgi:hypothetical protein